MRKEKLEAIADRGRKKVASVRDVAAMIDAVRVMMKRLADAKTIFGMMRSRLCDIAADPAVSRIPKLRGNCEGAVHQIDDLLAGWED